MNVIRNVGGYETSRDYKALFDLMTKSSVVCVVDYGSSGDCRDVAHTLYHDGVYQVSARGISYVYAETIDGFISQCERNNVEFIPPNTGSDLRGE